MQKITYTHTASGQSWDHKLPKILRYDGKSVMGITEENMAQFGIVKTIVEIEEPEPVTTIKRYSKLAIMRALETAGLWATVKNAITEAGRWDAFILAQDLAGDDPDFLAMKAAIDAMLPVDSETILQGCELGA
jgi:hypothetical protein